MIRITKEVFKKRKNIITLRIQLYEKMENAVKQSKNHSNNVYNYSSNTTSIINLR